MSRTEFEFKVVVAGPFGVGKTTLISNISRVPVVGTEVPTTGDEAVDKHTTTVGLEHGMLDVRTDDFDIHLFLYGTPGQARFHFMWDAVAIGADGFVVLIDASSPETWADAEKILSHFEDHDGTACVVGANRTASDSDAHRELTRFLGRDHLPIVACDVIDERSSRDLLIALLGHIIEREKPVPRAESSTTNDAPQSRNREETDLGAPETDRADRALAGGN